jgi:hypothetical protein
VSHTDAFALGRSELNKFLFADIGVEVNGMTLSVLSALARLGHDPWRQAERLAALPPATAVDLLSKIIAAMPDSPWSLPDAAAIATRLVTLLPKHQSPSSAPPVRPVLSSFRMTWQRAILLAMLALAVGATTLSLGGQRDAALDGNPFSVGAGEPPAFR